MPFKIGDRVVTCRGEVGYLEAIDDDCYFCDVRVQTPRDEPSCCVTMTLYGGLKDGTNVTPQPRSEEWHREARAFNRAIEQALLGMGIGRG